MSSAEIMDAMNSNQPIQTCPEKEAREALDFLACCLRGHGIDVQIEGTIKPEGKRFIERIENVIALMDQHAFDVVSSTLEPRMP